MSELNDRMSEALYDDFPWSRETPLSKEIIRIHASAIKGRKIEEAEACVEAAFKSLMRCVEVTSVTKPFIVAALRIFADEVEKNCDPAEYAIAKLLYESANPQTTVITTASLVDRSEIFGDEKK